MDHVRIGIVGCGNIAQQNIRGYVQHPRAEVVALCDTRRERAEARATQFGISPAIFEDYQALLDDPEIDAVELLTPTFLHAEQIIAALDAGKHVSCQKPIAVTLDEVERDRGGGGAGGRDLSGDGELLLLPTVDEGEGAAGRRGDWRAVAGADSHDPGDGDHRPNDRARSGRGGVAS